MRFCRHLILASAVAGAALSLLAAACGGGGTPRSVASLATTTTAAAARAATRGSAAPGGELAEYASCMRSHGISSFPDQASFGSSAAIRTAKGHMAQISQSEASSPRFQAAQRACAKYYGPGTSTPHVTAQEMHKLLAVSRCMRAHGVPDFPDPNSTTGQLTAPAGLDKNSPQVLAALRACRSLGQAAGLSSPNTGP